MAAIRQPATYVDENQVKRCWWCSSSQLYESYHDREWGWPVAEDQRLFEKICLEGFQSGLSWLTILNKRENFRRAFRQFDIDKVAAFRTSSVNRLLGDKGIVRHRGKIESTINNARQARRTIEEFGSLAAYFWKYEPARQPSISSREDIRVTCDEAIRLSKDLKHRGWSFVGPTTCYAFMQAMGMVNDHARSCWVYDQVDQARKKFKRPT